MKITLIGFMGSGKTTVAKELSQALGLPQVDLDQLIENRAGLSIPAYFQQFGEERFRQLEQELLAEALTGDGILSTGGGTPVQAANQAIFQNHSQPIIFLDASDATIQDRLIADGLAGRPLFEKLGLEGIINLKHDRQACYESLASDVITVDGKTPQEIAQEIINKINATV